MGWLFLLRFRTIRFLLQQDMVWRVFCRTLLLKKSSKTRLSRILSKATITADLIWQRMPSFRLLVENTRRPRGIIKTNSGARAVETFLGSSFLLLSLLY